MHTQMMTEAGLPVRPLGDDWLTRDPESFGDGVDMIDFDQEAGSSQPGRWHRLREDLMLYAAGITTGLAVVVAVLLMLTVFDSPDVAIKPPVAAVGVAQAPAPLASR